MFKPNFDPLPINPIRKLRDKELKLNIAQLSRAADITPQVIRDLELGLPKTIPDNLLTFFDRHFPNINLDVQYNDWRNFKRDLVYLPPVEALKISSDSHPFAQYRNKIGVAVSNLCEFLCVPRFVLMHYEREQKKMPKLLQEVLPQAHLPQSDVDKLANMGEMYYLAQERRRISEQQAHAR